MKKLNWKNLKESPFWVIAIIIGVSVSSTYYVVNCLIVEHYKLEIQRLEKVIDQRDKIANLDGIVNSLKNILDAQTKINETKQSINNQSPVNKDVLDKKWMKPIEDLINTGNSILTLEASSDRTLDLFKSWQNDCTILLSQIDSELNTNFRSDFITLTRMDRADYPQLSSKVNYGLSTIKTIKLYY